MYLGSSEPIYKKEYQKVFYNRKRGRIMTPRELVYATLEFRNQTGIVPRQMWTLPWSEWNHQEMVNKIHRDFPDDIIGAVCNFKEKTIEEGEPYRYGISRDAWGCIVTNIEEGVIGEVLTAFIAAGLEAALTLNI